VGRQDSRQHPQGGGLAGAVGTEQPDNLARRDGKADPVDGGYAVKRV